MKFDVRVLYKKSCQASLNFVKIGTVNCTVPKDVNEFLSVISLCLGIVSFHVMK